MATLFSRSKTLLVSLLLVAAFLLVGVLVQVNGDSMVPSLADNQIALVLRQSEIERFDVVVIKDGKKPSKRVIKRIIGLRGDEFINKQPVSEPFLAEIKEALAKDSLLTENIEKIKIPENSYFVLGDNRKISLDSRLTGAVHEEMIIGEAKFTVWASCKIR